MVRGSLFFCGPMGEKLFIEHNGGGIDSLFHDYLFIYFLRKKERKREDKKNKKKRCRVHGSRL